MAVLRLTTSSIGRRLHREIGRLFAFEDTIDVARGASIGFEPIRPVGDQTAAHREVAKRVDRRYAVARCKQYNQVAMNGGERAYCHDQAAMCIVRDGDCAFELAGIAQATRSYLHSKRRCHGLDGAQLPAAAGGTGLADHEDRSPGVDRISLCQRLGRQIVPEKMAPVCFGSAADGGSSGSHVRFTPKAD